MKMPPKSSDMEQAKEKLHEHYTSVERHLLHEADQLANSGFASKHWCSIARQHFEEGVMAMHRALRDFPGDDPNQYGKVPVADGLAPPPVDDQPNISEARRTIEWKDYKPDEGMHGPTPDRPDR